MEAVTVYSIFHCWKVGVDSEVILNQFFNSSMIKYLKANYRKGGDGLFVVAIGDKIMSSGLKLQ